MADVGGVPQGLNVGGMDMVKFLTAEQAENADKVAFLQEETEDSLANEAKLGNPLVAAARNSEAKKSQIVAPTSLVEKAKEVGEPPPIEAINEAADEFKQNNPDHKGDFVQFFTALWGKLKPGDTADKILSTIREACQQEGISDDASVLKVLQFLLKGKGPITAEVQKAIDLHVSEKKEAVQAGINIEVMARTSVEEGMGTPSEFKNDYVKLISEPTVDPVAKYNEWSKKFTFTELKPRLDNYLHALGADLKSNVTSMPQAELADKATMVRGIQAILGVPSFFMKRMDLVEKMFENIK